MQPTLDDVRALARRSRRTHAWALVAIAGALALVPAQLALAPYVAPEWVALGAVALGGALLLRFAYVAGEERGAYRKLFKDWKAARRLAVEEEARAQPPKAA